MAKQLLSSEWLARLKTHKKIIVGFSGGLDSTVLLHALSAHPVLYDKLLAVHINHSISPNSFYWQEHCKQIAQQWAIEFLAISVEFNRQANIEEGARSARYAAFSNLLTADDGLILGHHQDDQAETLLLQLFRGAGIDGLAGMPELSLLGQATVARPLLALSREELLIYAQEEQLSWIEDESNQDIHYSRNYLRQKILPLLTEKWPNVRGNLARAAAHCQQAQNNLMQLALLDNPELKNAQNTLSTKCFNGLSRERVINIIRSWIKNNGVKCPSAVIIHRIIDEVLWARTDAHPVVRWSDFTVRRYQQHMYLDRKQAINLPLEIEWKDFPAPCPLHALDSYLTATKTEQGLLIPGNAQIVIRFRKGGELFYWHGQNKALKNLFQQWQIPPWQRESIPLLYVNDQLAAVVGYAVSDLFFSQACVGDQGGACFELKTSLGIKNIGEGGNHCWNA